MEISINGVKYIPAASSEEWPRVFEFEDSGERQVRWSSNGADGVYFFPDGTTEKCILPWPLIAGWWPITDPTLRAKYIAAAEAWREKQSDPWPRWWKRITRDADPVSHIYRFDSPTSIGVGFSRLFPDGLACGDNSTDSCLHNCDHLARIPTSEAEALLAKWKAERESQSPIKVDQIDSAKGEEAAYPRVERGSSGLVWVYPSKDESTWRWSGNGNMPWHGGALDPIPDDMLEANNTTLITGPEAAEYVAAAREGRDAVWPPNSSETPNSSPAPLPTAEEVAETIIAQQCGIGRPAKYDPDQQVRLSYAAGLIANAIHRDRRSRESSELAKPEWRVKHDWTGAMGTVLMEHGGTSFVKWDDGQVTSVYNRHLQKELV